MAVSRTFNELSGRLVRRAADLERGVSLWTQNFCREIATRVIVITPYDTGKAKSNWVASINAPRTVDRPPLAPGKAAEGPAISEAKSIIRVYRAGDTFFLVNSLDYVVVDLNQYGKSRQAAAGFVRRAFLAGVEAGARMPLRRYLRI